MHILLISAENFKTFLIYFIFSGKKPAPAEATRFTGKPESKPSINPLIRPPPSSAPQDIHNLRPISTTMPNGGKQFNCKFLLDFCTPEDIKDIYKLFSYIKRIYPLFKGLIL